MKTKYICNSFILLAIISFFNHSVFGQEDYIKEYKRIYKANENTSLSIENKYGFVDIRDWNKPSVEIKAEIIFKNISDEQGDKLMELIDINFSENGNQIVVETDYHDSFFKRINRGRHLEDNDFEVNYIVMLPANIKVSVANKYGSIFISKLSSASKIHLKYGTLKINQLLAKSKTEMAEIELAYSKGTIESCQWVRLHMKYSELEIQKSKALLVMSKYSKLYIDIGSSLICESKYDTYKIGKLVNFIAEAHYSNFRFEQIKNKIILETKYTDVKIQSVPAGFKHIGIENSYGSIRIGIEPDASYKLNGYAKYTKISYPDNSNVNRFQENNEQRIKGFVGSDSSTSAKVKIETKYGGVNLY